MSKRKRIKGMSSVEVMVATSISAAVLATAIMLFIFGMSQWTRGQSRIIAESGSQVAVRVLEDELRSAMAVTVDENGLGLSYRMPAKDAEGNLISPAEWDGIERRLEYVDGLVRATEGTRQRVLTRNVVLIDPKTNQSYKLFSAGAGKITRQLTIMVVTKTNEYRTEYTTSRSRETVYLRNIPELTQQ